jgi:hypothetical protein
MPGWKSLTNICDPLAKSGTTGPSGACDFGALTTLIQNGMTDLILISSLLVIVALVTAGIKLVTSGGNPKALSDAKGMFTNIVIGYAVILTAWLVVYTITSTLLAPGFSLIK